MATDHGNRFLISPTGMVHHVKSVDGELTASFCGQYIETDQPGEWKLVGMIVGLKSGTRVKVCSVCQKLKRKRGVQYYR